MASLSVNGLEDVLKQLDKLSDKGKVDAIAKKAVNAAKGIVENATRSALGASERGPRATGSAAASVKGTDAKVNAWGVFSVAKPSGYDKDGTSNVKKANMLEYGTPTLGARPWRASAAGSAEGPATEVMEQIIASEMGAE